MKNTTDDTKERPLGRLSVKPDLFAEIRELAEWQNMPLFDYVELALRKRNTSVRRKKQHAESKDREEE